MGDTMTLREVNDRFESEWVLFGDVELTPNHEVIKGRVLCHSKDRDEVYRKLVELRPKNGATHFTGTMPAKSAVLL